MLVAVTLQFSIFKQKSQLHESHKTNVSPTLSHCTTVANARIFRTGQPHVILSSISHLSDDFYQYTTDSRLSQDRQKYKNPQKGQAYEKQLSEMSFGFHIKSHPIQKKIPYIYIYTDIPINCLLREVITRYYIMIPNLIHLHLLIICVSYRTESKIQTTRNVTYLLCHEVASVFQIMLQCEIVQCRLLLKNLWEKPDIQFYHWLQFFSLSVIIDMDNEKSFILNVYKTK